MKFFNSKSILIMFFVGLFSNSLLAANSTPNSWKSVSKDLADKACLEFYEVKTAEDQTVCKEVLSELQKWDPDSKQGYFWSLLMRFRHTYLYNDSVRGVIRGYFIPGLMLTAFKYSMGYEAMVDEQTISSLVHSSEALIEILKNIHKIPYGYQGNSTDLLTSGLTIGQHLSAAHEYNSLSYVLAASTIINDGQKYSYKEVILKHLQRLYQKSKDHDDHLQLVNYMLAI